MSMTARTTCTIRTLTATIQVNKDNMSGLSGRQVRLHSTRMTLVSVLRATMAGSSSVAPPHTRAAIPSITLSGAKSTPDAIKQDIANHPNGGAGKREYVRSMSNVTLKAADGAAVTINEAGCVRQTGRQRQVVQQGFRRGQTHMSATENNNICYWIGQRWSNITFEGLSFTGGVNIEAYGNKDTLIDNVKFDNCKFSITVQPQ